MDFIANSMRAHPEIAFFLALAAGFFIGKIKIGTFSFGATVGSLIAALLLGIWINSQGGPIQVPVFMQSLFFTMFIFAVGYKVGPQFILGLKGDGIPLAILSLVFCSVALLLTYITAHIFSWDKGLAAGFLAGCFTQSSTVGSATDAINTLTISGAEKKILTDHVAVAFAITSVFGYAGVPWWLTRVSPKLLGKNLKEECKIKEKELSLEPPKEQGLISALRPALGRAYKINENLANKKVSEIEALFDRVYVERIHTGSKILEAKSESIVNKGDVIAILGFRDELPKITEIFGAEVTDDLNILDFPIQEVSVIVTNKAVINKTLQVLVDEYGRRGIRLKRLIRLEKEMPFGPNTVLQKGDTLIISGSKRRVENAAHIFGYIDKPTDKSNITYIGLGIALGGLIGVPAFALKGISISLSTSVGVLLMGVLLGWLQAANPRFGGFPKPAMWIFESFGLSAFITVLGLNAGPRFIEGLLNNGSMIFLAGIAVAIIPHIICLFIGNYILKLNMGTNLGALAGADTVTPGIDKLLEESESNIPALGFTVPYAVANILLTIWGPILITIIP